MKVAIVTPCFREPDAWLVRCPESVRRQTVRSTHIVVSDGPPNSIVEASDTLHLRLPRGASDFGDTPRGIGTAYAWGLGFDAVGYLDADNWLYPRHVEWLLRLRARTKASILTSMRNFHHIDGHPIAQCLTSDGDRFCDTGCMMFTRGALELSLAWFRIPLEFHAIGDRIVWNEVRRSNSPLAPSGGRPWPIAPAMPACTRISASRSPRGPPGPKRSVGPCRPGRREGGADLKLRWRYRRIRRTSQGGCGA